MKKSKASPRKGREYWRPLVAEFEAAPCRHQVFAARHKINVGTFRSWLYVLRAEEPAPRNAVPKFVEVVAAKGGSGCTLATGGIELRFDRLPAAEYLAELLSQAGR